MDCSKTLNYVREITRMCNSYDNSCKNCALRHMRCTTMRGVTQENIDIVQKWSDEHPLITRREKLLKLLKDNGFEELIGENNFDLNSNCGELNCIGDASCNCDDCKAYWNEVVG